MELTQSLKNLLIPLYLLFPQKTKKRIKHIYYDRFVYPLYKLKYIYSYGRQDFFDHISIETTTHCNLRCPSCPNSKYERGLLKNKKLMSLDLFKKIINELASINYSGDTYFHFFGEPLCDERMPDLIAYATKKLPKSMVGINSNGFLMTPLLYKKLLNSGIKSILITEYGGIMPPEIKELLEYLKNHPEIENKIKYRRLIDSGLSNRGGEIDIKNPLDFSKPVCTYPQGEVNIDYSGNVVLCSNDYHSQVVFGNIKNKNLIDIWDSPYYKRLRKEIRRGVFRLPICKKCVGIE